MTQRGVHCHWPAEEQDRKLPEVSQQGDASFDPSNIMGHGGMGAWGMGHGGEVARQTLSTSL